MAMPRLACCARGAEGCCHHELRNLAQVEPQDEPQIGLFLARIDDLDDGGQVNGCDQIVMGVVGVRVVAEDHPLCALSYHADARFIEAAARSRRLLSSAEGQVRYGCRAPLFSIGPSAMSFLSFSRASFMASFLLRSLGLSALVRSPTEDSTGNPQEANPQDTRTNRQYFERIALLIEVMGAKCHGGR